MVGQGVLRECLLDPDIEAVLTVGRTATGVTHSRLREMVRADLLDYADVESDLRGFDAALSVWECHPRECPSPVRARDL